MQWSPVTPNDKYDTWGSIVPEGETLSVVGNQPLTSAYSPLTSVYSLLTSAMSFVTVNHLSQTEESLGFGAFCLLALSLFGTVRHQQPLVWSS